MYMYIIIDGLFPGNSIVDLPIQNGDSSKLSLSLSGGSSPLRSASDRLPTENIRSPGFGVPLGIILEVCPRVKSATLISSW